MRFTSSSFRRSLKQKKRARTLRKRLQRRQRTRVFNSRSHTSVFNSNLPSTVGESQIQLKTLKRTRRFRFSKQKGGLIPNSGDPSAKGVYAGPLKEENLPVEEAVLSAEEELLATQT